MLQLYMDMDMDMAPNNLNTRCDPYCSRGPIRKVR